MSMNNPITKQEFYLYMQDQIAAVAAYFYQQYDVGVEEHFWDYSFNGEIPQELLKSRTDVQTFSVESGNN